MSHMQPTLRLPSTHQPSRSKHAVPLVEQETSDHSAKRQLSAGELVYVLIAAIRLYLCWAPPGILRMGSRGEAPWQERCQTVLLTDGFWVGQTLVTQHLWRTVMKKNPSHFKGDRYLPVDSVSWNDCQKFVDVLNRDHGNALPDGWKFAIPTECQWEYFCRAGTTTPYNFGDSLNGDMANCCGLKPYGSLRAGEFKQKTTVVKSYAPNAWNIHDPHGNLSEWCADWYHNGDYPNLINPTGPETGTMRVLRGGSWSDEAIHCRSAYRQCSPPDRRSSSYGCRLVVVPCN